jgi:hypothetical protein
MDPSANSSRFPAPPHTLLHVPASEEGRPPSGLYNAQAAAARPRAGGEQEEEEEEEEEENSARKRRTRKTVREDTADTRWGTVRVDEGELLEERLDLALDLRERLDFHSCSACVLLRSEDA